MDNIKATTRTLSSVKPGEKVTIKKIIGKGETFKKILEMGVLPGTEIEIVKIAPLGDPVEILVKGYHLTLRKEETSKIEIFQ